MSMKKMLAVVAAAALVAIAAPAFAANPFSDVPMNHWAYDAVAQLTSRGVISGYPDGTFKGNKAMTRYEIASIIARSLANAEYATKEDMERLKALVVEFQPELEALGVTVDGFDSRLTKLEKGVGGVKIWGELDMDLVRSTEDSARNKHYMDRYRIWLSKDISDNITFTTRLGYKTGGVVGWDRYFFTVKDFFGMRFIAGQYNFNWDDEDGLVGPAWDPTQYGSTRRGYWLKKDFGMGYVEAYYATKGSTKDDTAITDTHDEYGLKLHFNFNEKIWASANYRVIDRSAYDNMTAVGFNADREDYWLSVGFKFMPAVEVKGSYYWQKHDFNGWDDANLWRVILDVKQDALKFTSLWIEYNKFDEGYASECTDQWNNIHRGLDSKYNVPALDGVMGATNDVKVLWIRADQKWNSKWGTYEQYLNAKDGVADGLDMNSWAIGVVYKYTPSLTFDLGFESVKHDGDTVTPEYKDNAVYLKTKLAF